MTEFSKDDLVGLFQCLNQAIPLGSDTDAHERTCYMQVISEASAADPSLIFRMIALAGPAYITQLLENEETNSFVLDLFERVIYHCRTPRQHIADIRRIVKKTLISGHHYHRALIHFVDVLFAYVIKITPYGTSPLPSRNTVALVTTHDLPLARLALDVIAEDLGNYQAPLKPCTKPDEANFWASLSSPDSDAILRLYQFARFGDWSAAARLYGSLQKMRAVDGLPSCVEVLRTAAVESRQYMDRFIPIQMLLLKAKDMYDNLEHPPMTNDCRRLIDIFESRADILGESIDRALGALNPPTDLNHIVYITDNWHEYLRGFASVLQDRMIALIHFNIDWAIAERILKLSDSHFWHIFKGELFAVGWRVTRSRLLAIANARRETQKAHAAKPRSVCRKRKVIE